MKILFTAFLILLGTSLFAQLQSDKLFNKLKKMDDIEYLSTNQDGKDSITGKKIPLFIQTVNIKKDNSSFEQIKTEIVQLIRIKSYANIFSANDDGNKLNAYFFDKNSNSEILIYEKEANGNITLISYAAKNLSISQKEQMKRMKFSSN